MNRIKHLRKTANITQSKLAKHMNVAVSTISHWENEQFEPDTDALIRLADYFGVSVDYLSGRGNDSIKRLQDDEQNVLNIYRKLDNKGKRVIYQLLKYIIGEQTF